MISRKASVCGTAIAAMLAFFAPALQAQEEGGTGGGTATAGGQGAVSTGDNGTQNFGPQSLTGTATGGAPSLGTGTYQRAPFRVSVSVREGYDDNVYTTKLNKVGSFFTNASAVFDYRAGTPRTVFSLEAIVGGTYYYFRPFGQSYDVNTSLALSVEHRATPRLTLSANAYFTYQTEPDFNSNFGSNRRAGNFFFTTDKFALGYQWTPRFSTVTSYTLGALHYDDKSIGSFEDRTEHTFGNEFRFLVLPTTTLVGEYRFEIIDFVDAPRDSTTHFLLAGVDHTFNPRFNVSLRAGVEFRDIDNFGERTSPYAESTLRYAVGQRTSINWVTRYGLEEPDVAGTQSRTTFRTGLNVNYVITSRLSATGAFFYQHDDNAELSTPTFFVPQFNEDSLEIGIALRYEINRFFALLAGYNHSEVFSDVNLREYSRNRYYVGLNATF